MIAFELSPYPIEHYRGDILSRISQASTRVFKDTDYIYLPANVVTELFSPERIAEIHEICLGLGAKVDVAIYTANIEGKLVPIHACLEILYKNKRIIGPVVISLSHRVITNAHVSIENKVAFVTQSVKQLRHFSDAVIIGMPQRKDESFTHNLFVDPKLLGATAYSDRINKNTFYFFHVHSGSRELLEDLHFHKICSTIYRLWSTNFNKLKPNLPDTAPELDPYIESLFKPHEIS